MKITALSHVFCLNCFVYPTLEAENYPTEFLPGECFPRFTIISNVSNHALYLIEYSSDRLEAVTPHPTRLEEFWCSSILLGFRPTPRLRSRFYSFLQEDYFVTLDRTNLPIGYPSPCTCPKESSTGMSPMRSGFSEYVSCLDMRHFSRFCLVIVTPC